MGNIGHSWDNGKENGNYYTGLHEPLSKLLVSPVISPIVVPYIIPYITPLRSLDYSSYEVICTFLALEGLAFLELSRLGSRN